MKTLRLLPLLLLLIAPFLRAETVASMPKPTAYVDDYAGVYSSAEKAEMEAVCLEVHDKIKAQIFIVTVHTLAGSDIEGFANELYRKWKIGDKKGNHGVLMLFAIDDHKRRIEVGYGLEPVLPDGKVGDIGRSMVPDLKAGNYGKATEGALRSVASTIAADANVTLDTLAPPVASEPAPEAAVVPDNTPPLPRFPWWIVLPAVLIFLVFVVVVVLILRGSRVTRSTSRSNDDDFFNNNSSSSSSDSSSSSSDSGSSSSSDSFSGGDGGDSGGGGASGDW